MLHGWAEILKTGQGGIERPNHLNIAKPLSVVQNCLQYVERTVYNVNEREKTALDQVQKLATATAEKKSFFGKKANAPVDLDSRRISVIGHGRQIAPESNHAAELLRHKLDKVLIDNRIFRRTKLIKCQMELWRGLEFCTKFMGTLYVYLGSEHKEKVPVRLVGNDQGLLKFGLSPKGSVTLGDINSHGTSVTEMVSPTTQLFDNFVSATEGISSVSMDAGTLQLESPMSSVSDPFQTYEQLVQPKDLTNIQTVKEQRKLGTSSLTSVSTAPPTKGLSLKERIANRLTKSMIKIHPMPIPQVDSEEEFAGLTKKDEADMRSQASLLMSQIEPASLKGNDQIRNSLGKLLNLNSTQASNLNEEDLVTTVQNKEDVPSVFVIPGSNMDISEDGPMDIPVYESIEYTPKPPSPEPKIRVQVPSIELSEASTGCALQLAIDQTPIETSSLPTSPQTGEPKKKAKKKKRHSSKPPKEAGNAVSPSAPPAELVIDENGNSIPIPITSPTKQRRNRHSSSRKNEKGPPPPPPLNPSAIGGNLEALPEPYRTPSLVVSSASMTNTRLVTALSNGDIKLSDAIPIPTNLSSSNLSMDTPSSNHSFVSTASAEPSSAPPSQTVTAKSPSPPPQIVNILENELKAMAPRAISPEAFEAENSQQIQQTNTKPKYTEMDSSEVKYPKLPGLSRVSTALPANSSHSLPDSKETVKRRPPPDPPKDSPATTRRSFNRKSSDEIIIPKYLANETGPYSKQ
ncbi:hypothetical protein BCR33DRAFT_126587 [Rhizoclosmatium globosum]|uniref:Uncharacterized protein n=1 Tax=Rhizoclosmatium globosum TaxID=329046 RepID=A0A1Y2CHB8_9FUNG|nr:hypothetical protein BCR33DRAFT_126587 [Rhizoclosmatium globosum]|eukprot:ORY46336.1 hypothetical protein BCR33DRAFT_126587 [Rhizoclosmatium globosum]